MQSQLHQRQREQSLLKSEHRAQRPNFVVRLPDFQVEGLYIARVTKGPFELLVEEATGQALSETIEWLSEVPIWGIKGAP